MDRGLWNTSLILVVLGLISLGAGVLAAVYEREHKVFKGKATGRIVDLIQKEGDGPYRNRYHPVVEYYAEGKLYKKTLDEGAYPSKWEIGQKIPLLYDPSDPERVGEDERSLIVRYIPAFAYTAGIILLLTGIYVFIRFALRG